MSDWGEIDDDAAEPGHMGATAALDELALDEERDSDFEGPDGEGIPDTLLAVRVWLDDSRRMSQVRVSNKWRRRLRGSTLSDRFREAFQLAYARLAPAEQAGFEDVAAPAPLDWNILAVLSDEAAATGRRAREAWSDSEVTSDEGHQSQTLGQGGGRMVTVVLDGDGLTEEVRFDEQWLEGANVDDLVDAVEEAHRDAYGRFAPAPIVAGTLTQLVRASTDLALETDAYLRRGSN